MLKDCRTRQRAEQLHKERKKPAAIAATAHASFASAGQAIDALIAEASAAASAPVSLSGTSDRIRFIAD